MSKYLRTRKEEPIFLFFCIFMLFLVSMNLWIGWDGRAKYFNAVFGILSVVSVIAYGTKLNITWSNSIPLFVICIAWLYLSNDPAIIVIFAFFFATSIIITLNNADRIRCLEFIFKWYAILLVPSIILYLISLFYEPPSLGTLEQGNKILGYHPYKNYLLYALPTSSNYRFRFNGPFLEPGHLGMMSAFLLLASGFRLNNWRTWVIGGAVLLSFSLAGYVLIFIAYIFSRFYQGKISFQWVVFFLALIFFVYLFVTFYNGGDNYVNEKIFARLETDEEKGFVGNNRAFGQIPLYYEMMWSNTKTMLFGYDRSTMQWLAEHGSRGTGFVMSMVSHGIIGTAVSVLFYFVYCFFCKKRKFAVLALAFVCLMFWQRSYPFWFSWIVCFVYGITFNNWYYGKRKI